jgi:hypothetical protein
MWVARRVDVVGLSLPLEPEDLGGHEGKRADLTVERDLGEGRAGIAGDEF